MKIFFCGKYIGIGKLKTLEVINSSPFYKTQKHTVLIKIEHVLFRSFRYATAIGMFQFF